MKELENRFIVINRRHLGEAEKEIPGVVRQFKTLTEIVTAHIPKNDYIVCNLDEPYADRIKRIILSEGDDDSCPFCGHRSELVSVGSLGPWQVECTHCRACTGRYPHKNKALKAWRRRV